MYELGKITDAYHQVPDIGGSYTGLDTIELLQSITYWYMNSGAFDGYSMITYAFHALPGGNRHQTQRTKLTYFKTMAIRSMKQKDIFLLKAGLESVSDEYIKLYDPAYVDIFNKLDEHMNRVEKDGYKVISLIKRLDVLYEFFVTKNDRDKMQEGKNAVDLWGTGLLDTLTFQNAKSKARETIKTQF